MDFPPFFLMIQLSIPADKKVYFASDFHLGFPDAVLSLEREKALLRWLESIQANASHLFLMGDLFDFWFEYGKVVPAGFTRFLGKLAEFSDQGIQLHVFVGNHDLWMWDYFQNEFKALIYREPTHLRLLFQHNEKNLWIGHGDGLGPGDSGYKLLKKVFTNSFAQFLFKYVHPNMGMSLAHFWSETRKKKAILNGEDPFDEKTEYIVNYIREIKPKLDKKNLGIDTYVFGHRHLPIQFPIDATTTYFNLGDWFNHNYKHAFFLSIDENKTEFKRFEP
ncbi:MAG: UDP-2,3-diacylglucosamine diphosphatase [Bacteroidota bacterium]